MGENQAAIADMLVELMMNEIESIRATGALLHVIAIGTLGSLVAYFVAPRNAASGSSSSSASADAQVPGPVLVANNERLRGRLHFLLRNAASGKGGKAAAAAHQWALMRHFSQRLHEVVHSFSWTMYYILL